MADLFRKSGLELVTEDVFATDRVHHETAYHAPMFTQSAGTLAMKWRISQGKMTKEEGDELVRRAVEETRSGDVYQHSEKYVVVGRKP